MNELKVFENEKFGSMRTMEREGEPWFVAADVCKALEIDNSRQALTRLDEDEKFTTVISNDGAATGKSSMSFVNEPGLYSLVLGSRKPEAKEFKRWVTHEVIPAIRKHGGYLTPQKVEEALRDPDTLIKILTDLKEEREQRKALTAQIKEDEPFTTFGKAIATANDAILLGDFAKIAANDGIKMGRNRMFAWLRAKGYLLKDNMPAQKYVDSGLFQVQERRITTLHGDKIVKTPLVTGKGQIVLIEKLKTSESHKEGAACGHSQARRRRCAH